LPRARILVTSTFTTPFIANDVALLSERYSIRHIVASGPAAPAAIVAGVAGADCVFSWFASTYASAAVAAARAFGRKSIIAVGGADVADEPGIGYGIWRSPWKAQLVRYALRNADRILAVDPYLAEQAAFRGAYPGQNIAVLPTGYDVARWTPGAERTRRVVTVAACDSEERMKVKGIQLLFDAARRIPDVPFTLVGIHERFLAALRNRAPANLVVLPLVSQEDLLGLYRGAAVYCQPSVVEGLPNAVCEAMLCGCLPVGTNVGGMSSAFGGTGILVPPGDPARLADGILKALAAPPEAGCLCRASVAERFPMEKRRDGLFRAVAELLG
jgi:glycosyltransferase involved in cell wall biosynthesis